MFESNVKKLILEEEGEKRREQIDRYEEYLSENIVEAAQSTSFPQLPIHNIISILSKVDFSTHNINILKQLITNMVTSHLDEPETLQLFHKLNLKKEKLPKLDINECISVFACFTNSDLCNMLSSLNDMPFGVDWRYISKDKNNEIEKLKNIIRKLHNQITNNSRISTTQSKSKIPPITEKTTKRYL